MKPGRHSPLYMPDAIFECRRKGLKSRKVSRIALVVLGFLMNGRPIRLRTDNGGDGVLRGSGSLHRWAIDSRIRTGYEDSVIAR